MNNYSYIKQNRCSLKNNLHTYTVPCVPHKNIRNTLDKHFISTYNTFRA
nr:MAG TPA_asm: hypothetical protein [Bacteriophage sp.]